MRKSFLLVLLFSPMLWALPSPREAELLYVRQDPGFGEALQDLRGRGDAWASYLTALDCLLHEREGEARKFLQQALSQESNERLKMSWLRQVARRSTESLRFCIDQARQLQRAHPQDDELQVGWLEIQGYEAGERGLFDLVESLHRSRWQLCSRHHWLEEQIRVGRQLELPWDTLYQVACTAPPGPRRQQMLLSILDQTPDATRWRKIMGELTAVPALERAQAEWRAARLPATRWMPATQVTEIFHRLLSLYQRQARLENEILLRQEFSQQFRLSDPEQADRQRRAALQLRRDHPQADPAYSPHTSLVNLTEAHARYLNQRGRPHQALAELEGLSGGRPADLMEAAALGYRLAETVGSDELLARYAKAQLELVEKLTPDQQMACLGPLLARLPQARASLSALYEPLLRSGLRDKTAGRERVRLLDSLSSLLSSRKDEPGQLQLFQEEMQRARAQGDKILENWARRRLLRYYEDHRQAREWKELALEGMQDPKQRPALLESSWWLAYRGDAEGLVWAEDSVRLCRQLQDRPGLAWALFIRAYAQLEMKRPAAALKDLQEAETLPGGVSRAAILGQQARALHDLGRSAEAIALLSKELEDGFRSGNFDTQLVLSPLVEYRREAGQNWEADYESSLDRVDGQGADGHRLGQQLLYEWLRWLGQDKNWQRGLEVLSRHPWDLPPADPRSQRLREFDAWKAQFGEPEATAPPAQSDGLAAKVDELRLAHPELGQTLTMRSTNLPSLRKHLDAHETLVTYCLLEDELIVLSLRPGQSDWSSSRVGSQAVAGLIRDYLAGLRSDQPTQAEKTLYSLLLEPVLRNDPSQRLLIVPSGPLWQLPWGALRDPQGQAAAGRSEIVLLSSGDLLRLADNSWKPYRLSAPLAIGAPPAADLPGAAQELQEVSRVLPDCQLRSGPQATLASLQQASQPWGLVHFASHAHYNRKQPTESDIELSDGSLRLKQLDQLALAEHSLVALSCCQGGDSKGQALDEPVTLATGFSAAGAETVIANLWKVDDEVARLFFLEFYRQLAQGASPLTSFTQAQTATRKHYPLRRDWGGFFLLGNPS
ncbi:MAG: CHAT domain-containing protein [Candidatus Eremiobacteraeota bacterium]|nr:CHAT domain-containing protein [Candidatus Eremiobacteraeota bacterium]